MKKRCLALLLALVMTLGLLPATALAAGPDDGVTVKVAVQMDDMFLYPQTELTVRAGTAAQYGFENAGSVEAGTVTALDALVAAHVQKYGGAFTSETAGNYLTMSGGNPGNMFGADATGRYSGFAVNHDYPKDSSGNGYMVNSAPLADGDVLDFFYYSEEYTDYVAWFTDPMGAKIDTLTAGKGVPVTLGLEGYMYMAGYADPSSEKLYDTEEGLSVYRLENDTDIGDLLFHFDSEERVSLTFTELGTQKLVAMGTESTYGAPIIMPVLTVNVQEEAPEEVVVPTGVTVEESAVSLPVNRTYQIRASVEPANAKQGVTYEKLFGDIEISETGLITPTEAANVGSKAMLQVKCAEKPSLTALITVTFAEAVKEELDLDLDPVLDAIAAKHTTTASDWWWVTGMTDYAAYRTDTAHKLTAEAKQAFVDSIVADVVKYPTNSNILANAITGLSALGYDPTDITAADGSKLNAVELLTQVDVESEKSGSWCWFSVPGYVLLACNQGDYATQELENAILEFLLANDEENGGWSTTWGVDSTAMTLQGLAPYYDTNAEVKQAADRAVAVLADKIAADGCAGNVNSDAMVLLAMSALGIELDDPRFMKDGKTLAEDFLAHYDADKASFGSDYADKQAFLAAVAAAELLSGKTSYNAFDFSAGAAQRVPTVATQENHGLDPVLDAIAAKHTTSASDWWWVTGMTDYTAYRTDTAHKLTAEAKQAFVDSIVADVLKYPTNSNILANAITGLSALGYDPTDITAADGSKLNAVELLTRVDVESEKSGSWCWFTVPGYVLLACNQGDYATQELENAILEFLLANDEENGGWSTTWGVDSTAMTLQGLAPYYDTNAEVKQAADRAVAVLADKIAADGCAGNVNSDAMVLLAMSALGIDLDDPRFMKDGKTLAEDFLTHYDADTASFGFDYADKQAFLAAVAAAELLSGKTSYNAFDFSAGAAQRVPTVATQENHGLDPVLDAIAAKHTTTASDWWWVTGMTDYAAYRTDTAHKLTAEAKQAFVDSIVADVVKYPTNSNILANAITGLSALGYDPTDITAADGSKLNAVELLTQVDVESEKSGSWCWFSVPGYVLLACNQGDYATQELENAILEFLLANDEENGGWSTTWGVDSTAMTLQGLAPYYDTNAEVKQAADRAVAVLADKIAADGCAGNVNSDAMVLLAMSALGIELDDPRFMKDGKTLAEDFLTHYDADTASFGFDYADKQAFLAAVAAAEQLSGKTSYNAFDFSAGAARRIPTVATQDEKKPDPTPIPPAGDTMNVSFTLKTHNATWIRKHTVAVPVDATVADVFYQVLDGREGFSYEGTSNYIRSITYNDTTWGEFDAGPNSGWKYKVNGEAPVVSMDAKTLEAGDDLVWYYVTDYTQDPTPDEGGSLKPEESKPEISTSADGQAVVEVKPSAEVDKNGAAGVAVTEKELTAALKAAGKDAAAIVITPEIRGEAEQVTVTLPKSSVSDIAKGELAVTVNTGLATVTLPADSLSDLSGRGGSAVSVTAKTAEDGAVTVEVMAGKKTVEELAGGLTVSLPAPGAGAGTVLVLVDAQGNETILKTAVAANGAIDALIPGSATLKVVDNTKTFQDVAGDHWGADAITFVSSREIFNGTGEGNFSPSVTMSRAMVMTALYRLSGDRVEAQGDEWYAEGMAWAKEKGISDGTGPEAMVSREQLATMLWRYAGSPESEGSLDGFADGGEASSWAAEALTWAAETGILTGDQNKALNPGNDASRAEVAAILMRYLEKTAR